MNCACDYCKWSRTAAAAPWTPFRKSSMPLPPPSTADAGGARAHNHVQPCDHHDDTTAHELANLDGVASPVTLSATNSKDQLSDDACALKHADAEGDADATDADHNASAGEDMLTATATPNSSHDASFPSSPSNNETAYQYTFEIPIRRHPGNGGSWHCPAFTNSILPKCLPTHEAVSEGSSCRTVLLSSTHSPSNQKG